MKCEFNWKCKDYREGTEVCISYDNEKRMKECGPYKSFVFEDELGIMHIDEKVRT